MATRFKSVIAFLAAVMVVATAACAGDPPVPTPNIEATVEARVAQERAVDATVKAKSKVEASLQAPTTDTPTPAPRPTPIFTSAVNQSPQASPTQIPTATVVATSRLSPTHTPPPTPSPAEVARKLLDEGLKHFDERRLDEAIAAFTEVIRFNPEHPDAYRHRGIVYGLLGQPDRMFKDLDHAIHLDPQSADNFHQRSVANLAVSQFSQAVRDSGEAILLNPEHASAYHLRALAHMGLDHLYEAQRDVQTAIRLGSESAKDTVNDVVDRLATRRLEDFDRFIRACYNGEPRLAEFNPSDQQAFRRAFNRAFGQPFSSYSQLTHRAYVKEFCRFKGIEPITNFYQNDDVETAFLSYLMGPQPTPSSLSRELGDIICAFQAEPEITSFTGARFKELFGSPYQAAAVAIQPHLLGVAPRQRSAFFTNVLNILLDRFANNPERYEGVEGISNVFSEREFNKNCPEDGEPTDATAVDPPTALDPEAQKRLDAFNEEYPVVGTPPSPSWDDPTAIPPALADPEP